MLAKWNQSESAYQAYDAKGRPVENFKAKWQAENRGLREQAPDLYAMTLQIVRQYPELKSRAWRGAIIAVKRLVNFAPSRAADGVIADVRGHGSNIYEIGRQDGMLTCTCEDWRGYNAPIVVQGTRMARMCKHIIAYRLSRAWRDDAPPMEPTTFANGDQVSHSLVRAHVRFIRKNGRQAADKNELMAA